MADAFDDAPVAIAELPQIKLFGKWPSEDVNHSDMSLAVSICLCNSSTFEFAVSAVEQNVIVTDRGI